MQICTKSRFLSNLFLRHEKRHNNIAQGRLPADRHTDVLQSQHDVTSREEPRFQHVAIRNISLTTTNNANIQFVYFMTVNTEWKNTFN